MSNIHFVQENKPGVSMDATQVRALRSHVRRVNLERQQQKSTERLENFRSLSVGDFSQDGRVRPARRRESLRSGQLESLDPALDHAESSHTTSRDDDRLILSDIETSAFDSLSLRDDDTLPRQCTCKRAGQAQQRRVCTGPAYSPERDGRRDAPHPYASQVSAVVQIDEARVSRLLKSCAFQIATEPLFTTHEADGDLTTLSVFPECLHNSAFLYALLYSILHTHNSWRPTSETLHLKGRAIENLKNDLAEDNPTLRVLSVGTILILCGTAYRSGDLAESRAHADGLYQLVQLCRSRSTPLPSDVLRAVFWQDLVSSAIAGDRRRFSEADFPTAFNRSSHIFPAPPSSLPLGFALHRDVINYELIQCIRDVNSLQILTASADFARSDADDFQTSIESRLVSQEQVCQYFGTIAECCRIATYIVCYTCYNAGWKSSFVPLRLAEKLLSSIAVTSKDGAWQHRRDVLLWLVLVGASVSEGENCFATALKARYREFIQRLMQEVEDWVEKNREGGSLVLQTAIQGFIYAPAWIDQRHLLPHWVDLERLVSNFDVGDDAQEVGAV